MNLGRFNIDEGAITNGQSRETGNTKGQSQMDNPEKLATRRGNQTWTIDNSLRITVECNSQNGHKIKMWVMKRNRNIYFTLNA
jgi:hypothetical protein